jgi:hypothetical protein
MKKPSYLVYILKNLGNFGFFTEKAKQAGYLEGHLRFSPPGTNEPINCLTMIDKNIYAYNQAIIYNLSLYIPLPPTGETPEIAKFIEQLPLD